MWANVMARIHSNLKGAKFEKPAGVTKVTVCSETGRKARTGCVNPYDEYFLPGTIPTICSKHSGSELSSENSSTTNKPTTSTNSFDQ